MSIPYEEIDVEIRPLVKLLNAFPGIQTTFSCAGHEVSETSIEDAYVSFVANSQDDLKRLLEAIPLHSCCTFRAPYFQWNNAWVDVTLGPDGRVHYALRVAGVPQYMQRQKLEQIEKSLLKAKP